MRRIRAKHVAVWWLGLACTAVAAVPPGLWLDIPYVKQPRDGCGAACISMVLQYWARKDPQFHCDVPSVEPIQQELYSAKAHGIYARDMERYLQQKGLRVFVFRGNWEAIQDHIAKGRPLIVCLREGHGLDRTLHYVVVVGFNRAENLVLLNDPAGKKLAVVRLTDFEKSWRGEHYWTLLALPPL